MTYKKFTGYSPGIATVGDGNTNARFHQEDTLKRIFERLENAGIHINRARMDCGSCSEAIVEMVEKHCRHFISVPTDVRHYMMTSLPCADGKPNT